MEQKKKLTPHSQKPSTPKVHLDVPTTGDTVKVKNKKILDPSFEFTLERIDGLPFNCMLDIEINLSCAGSFLNHISTLAIKNKVVRPSLDFQIPFGDENFPTTAAVFSFEITVTLIEVSGIGSRDTLSDTIQYTPSLPEKISTKKVSK
jgi:hypothetical protein